MGLTWEEVETSAQEVNVAWTCGPMHRWCL